MPDLQKSVSSSGLVRLAVIPAVYLLMQLLLKADYRYFFLSAHDPAYGYLFNGLNLAMGNPKLGLFAHPGAPLHVLTAVNLFVFKLVHGHSAFPALVLSNPEFYLQLISIELILLNSIALLSLGHVIMRHTGNPALAISAQLIPFVSVQGFAFGSLVMLEPLLLFTALMLMAILVPCVFGNTVIRGKSIVAASILVAFGLSAKVVFLPVALLPLFVIDGLRRKLTYLGLTALAMVIFLAPMYAVLPLFVEWIRNLFMHTGQYGSGSTGIIDLPVFISNLGRIIMGNGWFTVCLGIAAGLTIITAFPRFRGRSDGLKIRFLRGLLLVFFLNILMVAKHYSIHYLIISHNLTIPGFLVSIAVIRDIWFPKRELQKSMTWLIVVVGAGCLVGWMTTAVGYSQRLRNPRMESLSWAENQIPRIIVLEAPGPFQETALYHGMSFSGDMKGIYATLLRQMYPVTFFYYAGEDRLADWSHDVNRISLLARYPEIRIWYTSRRDTLPAGLAASLGILRQQGVIQSVQLIRTNPVTHEFLYRVVSDTASAAASITAFPEEIQEVKNLRLAPDNPYGANTEFVLQKGFYEISVRRKSREGKGFLVVTAAEGEGFYLSEESADSAANGWDHLSLVLNVSDEMEGRKAKVYLWYPREGECVFSDLQVIRHEVHLSAIDLP